MLAWIFFLCNCKHHYPPIFSKTTINRYCKKAQFLAIQKQYLQALSLYKKVLSLNDYNIQALVGAAHTSQKVNIFHDAALYYLQAYEQQPENKNYLFKAANAYAATGEWKKAQNIYAKILTKHPQTIEALHNYGFVLQMQGNIAQAIKAYKNVVTLKPHDTIAHINLALAYLSTGAFKEGWEEYEWRKKLAIIPNSTSDAQKLPTNLLQQRVDNKKIVLQAEQGIGDCFQFVRYAKELKNAGAYLICKVPQQLKRIITLCPYIDKVVDQTETLNEVDHVISLMSCPYIFNTSLNTIPKDIPYLYADNTLVQEWHKKIPHTKDIKIGICWRSNTNYKSPVQQFVTNQKSIPLEKLKPLTNITGVKLFSLQKIMTQEEKNIANKLSIFTFEDNFDLHNGSFMDTAAIIKHMDLVITIDSAIAHLAGGLGTATWTILPYPADWRWMNQGSQTPWYPTMRLFRQKKDKKNQSKNTWESLIEELSINLKKEI
jgi:tetratricopeptide (TPR) repeat protein